MKKLLLLFLLFVNGLFVNAQGCGSVFTDTGGITGNYSDSQNITTEICPTQPGDMVTLNFTSFDLENNSDFLSIYNGTSQVSPIIGSFTGNTLPPTITASNSSGCLTVVFTSNGNTTATGWIADVTCMPQGDCINAPVGVVATAQSDTTAVVSWQNATGNPTEISVILVQPQGMPAPTYSTAGIPTTSNSSVITGLSPNTCYDIYVRNVCATGVTSYWSAVTNVCTSDCQNTGQCLDSAVLIAFLDSNGNGIKDANENNFPAGSFYVTNTNNTNTFYYSDTGTAYIPAIDPNLNYNFNYSVYSSYQGYYNCATSYTNVTIPAGSGTQYYYFPVTEVQPYTDVSIAMSANNPRPGFPRNFYVNYYNQSLFTSANGTITFTKTVPENIISVSDPNAVLTPTGFTLDYTNLAPFQYNGLSFLMQTPTIPTVNLGDILTSTITITSDITENNTNNNTVTLNQTVVGSYDPNEVQEQHGKEIVWSTFTPNDYLYYTISFENTGTAPTSFIRIEDVLDNQLNPETIEMVTSSHDCQLRRTGNNLIWNFYNTQLPPTATNPEASHGFVTFKIKPNAGYAVGDIILNTAQIYFDYNPGIITNTWETEFVTALTTQNQNIEAIKVYPNPATNTIFIKSNQSIDNVTIYDTVGKKLLSKNNVAPDTPLDINSFDNGFYLIEITSQNKKSTIKFLKK